MTEQKNRAEYAQRKRYEGMKAAESRRAQNLQINYYPIKIEDWKIAMQNVRYESFPDVYPYNLCSRPPLSHSRIYSASSVYSTSMS